MKRRFAVVLLAVLTLAPDLRGEEAADPPPDYSRPKLRFIFRDYLEPPPSTEPRVILGWERWGWKFRYMPFMVGATNAGGLGVANPLTTIDPFYLTGTSFPETKDTYRPLPTGAMSLNERMYRRQMLRVTREANEKDDKR